MNKYIVFLFFIYVGCQPVDDKSVLESPTNRVDLGKAPTIWVEPDALHLAHFSEAVYLDVIFSNSTDHLVVLAKNDIDLCENIAFLTRDKLKRTKNKDEILSLGFFNPVSVSPSPDVVRLNPGDVFKKSFELDSLIPHGLSRHSAAVELYAVFFGWPTEFGLGYSLKNFPEELRPYVWQNTVTSMPVIVTIGKR